jgi:hypothetical protein
MSFEAPWESSSEEDLHISIWHEYRGYSFCLNDFNTKLRIVQDDRGRYDHFLYTTPDYQETIPATTELLSGWQALRYPVVVMDRLDGAAIDFMTRVERNNIDSELRRFL